MITRFFSRNAINEHAEPAQHDPEQHRCHEDEEQATPGDGPEPDGRLSEGPKGDEAAECRPDRQAGLLLLFGFGSGAMESTLDRFESQENAAVLPHELIESSVIPMVERGKIRSCFFGNVIPSRWTSCAYRTHQDIFQRAMGCICSAHESFV